MTKKPTRPSNLKFKSLPVAALLLLLIGGGQASAANAPSAPAETVPVTTNAVADEDAPKKPMVEAQINEVASSKHTAREKAAELFKLFTQLDPQDQRKVALAAVQQVDDANYAVIRVYLLDPKLDPRVLSVFMTDTLKRKNSIKLPMLLELAQMDGHPLQAESRELLVAFLKKNYGTNWTKWEDAVRTQLAENPN